MLKHDKDPKKYPYINDNLLGITDIKELDEMEKKFSVARVNDILSGAVSVDGSFDFKHLKSIHKYIFQDIYAWSGEIRDVSLSKDNTMFCMWQNIESSWKKLVDPAIARVLQNKSDENKFFYCLADAVNEINAVHPFREGNGRTKRVFLAMLAKEAGYVLDYSRVSPTEMLKADKDAYHNDNINGLAKVLKNCVSKRTSESTKAREKLTKPLPCSVSVHELISSPATKKVMDDMKLQRAGHLGKTVSRSADRGRDKNKHAGFYSE